MMAMLDGIRVLTTALNVPGPAACARLRDLGAAVTKIEPSDGDPLARYAPDWYADLHRGADVLCLDLKSAAGRERLDALLDAADVLVTAQRPGRARSARPRRRGLRGASAALCGRDRRPCRGRRRARRPRPHLPGRERADRRVGGALKSGRRDAGHYAWRRRHVQLNRQVTGNG